MSEPRTDKTELTPPSIDSCLPRRGYVLVGGPLLVGAGVIMGCGASAGAARASCIAADAARHKATPRGAIAVTIDDDWRVREQERTKTDTRNGGSPDQTARVGKQALDQMQESTRRNKEKRHGNCRNEVNTS